MISLSDEKMLILLTLLTLHPDILNIKNVYFDNMVSKLYSLDIHVNSAYTSDTKVTFLDLQLAISNNIYATKKL